MALAVLLPATGYAQSDTTAKAIPQYDVEIVIFKNTKVPKSREFILPVHSPARDESIFDLSSSVSVAAAAELGYKILPDQEFRLVDAVAKLVKSPRYELLTHVSWRQPGLERGKALPVWIKGGRIFGNEYTSIDSQLELLESIPAANKSDDSEGTKYEFDEQTLESLELQLLEQQNTQRHQGLYELEGKITIALSRYLHTYTDLVLRRPRLSVDPVPNNPTQESVLATYSADTRILNNHSLKEHRRMRSKNLHYLDNPEFSMLILITPYKVKQDSAEAPIETETTTSE